jgi:hypothetical protein
MTEATRTQVTKPARRLSAAVVVVWTGLALGTFLAVEALTHGVMLPWFGGFADAILTFILILVACAVLADLTRRHHRAAGRLAARHGKRGAIATARGTRKHGGRGVNFAVRHGKRGTSAAYRGARKHGGRGAAFVGTQAKSRWDGWRTRPEPEAAEWLDGPPLSVEWDTPPAVTPSPASQSPNSTGGTNMTGNGTRQPARARRTAANGGVPGAWGAVVAHTADFQAESDGDLLNWMRGEALGAAAYAEALVEQHETCLNAIGVDPVAIQTLHDVADAAVQMAATMAAAVKKFAEHYELPTQFVADGGLLAHDGRWHKGDDS